MKTSILMFCLLLLAGLNASAQNRGHHQNNGYKNNNHNNGYGYHGTPGRQAPIVYQPVYNHHGYHHPAANYGPARRGMWPAMGFRVNIVPAGYYRWMSGPRAYYYHSGICYTQVAQTNQYEVVRPPIGSTVPYIPENYNEISRNGELLYEVNGVLYRAVDTRQGLLYEVVGYMDIAMR